MVSVLDLSIAVAIFFVIYNICQTIVSYLSSSKLPPGNIGLPLLGETLAFVPNPAKFIQDRMTQLSPDVFRTSIAGEKMAICCGQSGNKFIYTNESKFKTWLPRTVVQLLSLTSIDSTSPSWKLFEEQLHKFLRLECMQHFVPIIDTKTREHIEMHWVPFNEVKVQPLSKELTFSLSSMLFLNISKSEQVSELAEPYYTLVDGLMAVPINIPGTTFKKAMKASKVLRDRLIALIRSRKLELLAKGDDVEINGLDLLSRVLIASNQVGDLISEEELAGKIVALLFASFHTTSNSVAFLVSHLAEHPDIYAKVLQEQLEVCESKREGELLTWKDIQRMKYSWNVICESMRLKSPSLGGFREVNTDINYAGYTIPKGWKVHWSVYSTHMDPVHFPNPEKFDPSRFETNLPRGVFMPFGSGPHMCCGKEYARIATLVFLSNVVAKFKFSKSNPNERLIYTPDPVCVEGLRVQLHSHQNIQI